MVNPDHSPETRRISRIVGQLKGVEKMIVSGEYCPNILVQTKAISHAIASLETKILEKHIDHCVKNSLQKKSGDAQEKIKELIDIFKKRLK